MTEPVSDGTEEGQPSKTDKENPEQADRQKKHAPVTVDFDSLRTKPGGSHVIAWLYVEALDLSYPVMYSGDNSYYLRRNMQGDYEVAGSAFLDGENRTDFTDKNSIIFGHNMADGSMFGRLKEFSLADAYSISPYVWILTEQAEYCYQIFSVQVADPYSECYTLFSQPADDFVGFLNRMRQNSGIDTGEWVFQEDDKILTLSTCNGAEGTSSRYVVQALKINE